MNKLISAAFVMLFALTTATMAQEKPFFISATVGYNSYLSVNATGGNSSYYSGASVASPSWSDKKLMVGFEGGVYISKNLRVLLGGGYGHNETPGKAEYVGSNEANIPSYGETPDKKSTNATAFVGADYCFNTQHVVPFVGLRGRGAYGNSELKYNNAESMGKSLAETWTYGGAIVFGADYIFQGGLIIGCQFDLCSYTYGAVKYKPQPGLATNKSYCHDFGAIAAPMIRIGFNF